MKRNVYIRQWFGLLVLFVLAMPLSGFSQTQIQLHKNKYQPAQDIELGRQAANEVQQKMPLIRDQQATDYLQVVGQRLVNAIPPEFQHPEFRYTFQIVDDKQINAFALPGGPMFVNRGMIESARTEGEMAGVMAHEISHVALRHGTAQATKGESYKTLGMLGGIAGNVMGGGLGSIISQGAQMGTGMYLLKFSREYETEADLLGAQIMARAGYDPRDLANMFKTIQGQGGGGTPQFLSDHPNPENRYQKIEQEAAALKIAPANLDAADFVRNKERLAYGGQTDRGGYGRQTGQAAAGNAASNSGNYPAANSGNYPAGGPTNSVNNSGNYAPGNSGNNAAGLGGRIDPPSTNTRSFSGPNNAYRFDYPDNWRNMSSDSGVWVVPEGAYGDMQGRMVITHGVNVGVAPTNSRDLRQATDQFIQAIHKENPDLKPDGSYQRATLGGRNALQMNLTNISEVNRRTEVIIMRTILLRNGSLFYVIALAPQDNFQDFQPAFQNLVRSLQIVD